MLTTRRYPSRPPRARAQNVIDGDLCEAFAVQPVARQRAHAADLAALGATKTAGDVLKFIEDMRAKI